MARRPRIANTSPAATTPVDAAPAAAPVAESGTEATGADLSAPVADPAGPLAVPVAVAVVVVVAVVVTALQPVRRRAGRIFTPEPVRIAMDDLSDAELLALAGDPLLAVRTEMAGAV